MTARILVIEDNPANLELMTYLLRAHSYEPLCASNGEKGLALAQSTRPDIVVCDIQLPTMDGFEVVRRLKSDPAPLSRPRAAPRWISSFQTFTCRSAADSISSR